MSLINRVFDTHMHIHCMLLARILWILAYVLWDTSMYTMWYWHSYCVTLTCALCDTDMLVVWHSLVHCVTMTCALYDTDMYIVWHSHVNCVVLTCILCDTAMCVVSHWHVYCVTQTVYSVGFLTSNYFRVFLDSKYENSQLRSEKAGFHFHFYFEGWKQPLANSCGVCGRG